eukprot:TRINITY_DN20147_c0_g1_i3.p1 TRINITY_DN20147_c0_g1~~TRINITY_DN20147_c0_g1_i3.p1  ORF type:complete len:538 (+),score=109.56 TRINITY_DN20147_c0_g1_i3:426-2039(+)
MFKLSEKDNAQMEVRTVQRFNGQQHPHVCLPLDFTTHRGHVTLMSLRLGGGDLFDHVNRAYASECGRYCEEAVRQMFFWLAAGVQFLHSHGVVHRDLKPENIMGGIQSNYLKVIDLGASEYYQEVHRCGGCTAMLNSVSAFTPGIISKMFTSKEAREHPATLKRYKPFKNDVYSLGCILYMMMMGRNPRFDAQEMFSKMDEVPDEMFSPGCKQLLKKMLAPEDMRITINEVVKDPWLTSEITCSPLLPDALSGLITIACHKVVSPPAGDYYVKDIGTKSYYVIAKDTMDTVYDVERAVRLEDLTTEAYSALLPQAKKSFKAGMRYFYPARRVKRRLLQVNEAVMATMLQEWGNCEAESAEDRGSVQVRHSECIPKNKEVFDLVAARIEQQDPNFELHEFEKLGVFGRQVREDDPKGSVVVKRNFHALDEGEHLFVYLAPWGANWHPQLVVQTGDWLVYNPSATNGGAVYTLEREAVEKSFMRAGSPKKRRPSSCHRLSPVKTTTTHDHDETSNRAFSTIQHDTDMDECGSPEFKVSR